MITNFGLFLLADANPAGPCPESCKGPEPMAGSACFSFLLGGTNAGRATTGSRDEAIPKLARGFRIAGFDGADFVGSRAEPELEDEGYRALYHSSMISVASPLFQG